MADRIPIGAWIFAAGVLILIAINLPSLEGLVHGNIAWLIAVAGVLITVGTVAGLAEA